MNPKAVALLILVVALVVVALGALAYWLISRQAGVRRREYKQMQVERNLALRAIRQIETKTDQYLDLESPLATEIRTITRDLNDKRMELSA